MAHKTTAARLAALERALEPPVGAAMAAVMAGLPTPTLEAVVAACEAHEQGRALTDEQRAEVNGAIRSIATNPEIGQVKTADLAGVSVYKFPVVDQQCLLAYYQESNGDIVLLALGVHESFP